MWTRYCKLKLLKALWKIRRLDDAVYGWNARALSRPQCNLTSQSAWKLGKERTKCGPMLDCQRPMDSAKWRHVCGFVLIAAMVIMAGLAHGQSTAESLSAAPEEAAQAPIPLADLVTEAESLSAQHQDIQADLSADRTTESVAERLPEITREIDGRLRESRKIVVQSPSLEMLRGLEGEWSRLKRELSGLNRALTNRVNELGRYIVQLDDFAKRWDQTFAAARNSSVPPEVLRRIENTVNEIRQAREAVERQRARALTIQSRVGVQDSRISDALMSVRQAREKALDRLFLRDSVPIWSLAVPLHTAQDLQKEIFASFSRQWTALRAYLERQTMRFVLAIAIFIVLATALFWVRWRGRGLSLEESGPAYASPAFEMPIAAALLLSLIGSGWIFPQTPRLLWAILGAFALIPSVMIVRRFITSELYPTLYALMTLFFLDQLRTLAAAVQVLPRLLFMAEMLGVTVFSVWLVRAIGSQPVLNGAASRDLIKSAGYVALAISSTALAATVLGYVTFANLLGNALLQSCYLALILYAVIEILDAVVTVGLSLPPFAALATVRRYRSLLSRRVRRGLQSLALLLWVLAVLQRLLLREKVFSGVQQFLSSELAFGSIHISPGDVLAFVITVWAAFLVSRFVRFLLDEDIYPRVRLKRGLSYAISNTLHYFILVVGFFLAVAALGFDMTQVTILAGAFSVGVGFGLQNVFNNFISGLILLFERPINIGDVVQIEDASGVVERIGVRASIIRTTNGSEIIMPNGKLISERLVNWTLSSRQHGIELPIAVAQGTDPKKVTALLEQTAAGHPLVTGDPPPQALVVKLGPDSLGFELRAWTDHSEQWMQIRSDLAIAISSALAAEKITIR
jgi:small-conductance mechanosensitive channel